MEQPQGFWSTIKKSLNGEEYDYTQGNIRRAIVLLAIPMILELALESVFALVDMAFVSRLPNAKNALATVGLTETIMSLIYTIGIGISMGTTAIIARRVGEKNYSDAAHSSAQAILIGLFISVIISVFGIVFSKPILGLLNASAEVVESGYGFMQIQFLSAPSIILLFLINGIFRGAGNASMAMWSLWIASGMNIILCPLLIWGIGSFEGFGLTGAALATAIGRTSGVCFQMFHLYKQNNILKLNKNHFLVDSKLIKAILEISWPATLQFFLQSGSWIFMTYLVSRTGGTEASAAYQIAIRNIVFFILPAWGISNAAATLVGQNLGAQQAERAEKSAILTMKYNIFFMAFVTVIFTFFSNQIISLFSSEKEIIVIGSKALEYIGYGYIFYGIGMVMIQALNGAGDTTTPTWLNLIAFWLIQIPLAWFLAEYLSYGPTGVFVAVPLSETILAIMAWYFFKKGKWKTVKV